MSGAACAKELLCFRVALAVVNGRCMETARVEGLHEYTTHLIAGRYTQTAKQEAAYIDAVNCLTTPGKFKKAFAALAAAL
jgi:hypothetical protein